MLQNASLLAIVAVHTAENEASEVGDGWKLDAHATFLQFAEQKLRSPDQSLRFQIRSVASTLFLYRFYASSSKRSQII